MAKLSTRMSRSGAKRRAEPIRHQIMEIVNLVWYPRTGNALYVFKLRD